MSSLTIIPSRGILRNKLGKYISLGRDTWGLFPMQPSIISESIVMSNKSSIDKEKAISMLLEYLSLILFKEEYRENNEVVILLSEIAQYLHNLRKGL